MMVFVFSHRYSKGDNFIVETVESVGKTADIDVNSHVDFTIVRDVMYKYSKKA